eukprot:scpid102925/ scgid5505/ 
MAMAEDLKAAISKKYNVDITKLSHKERRNLLKKEKQRLKRRQAAVEAECEAAGNNHDSDVSLNSEDEATRRQKENEEQARQHDLWLKREEEAQLIFQHKQAELERERKLREEQQLRLKAELAKLEEEKAENDRVKNQVDKKKEERRQVGIFLVFLSWLSGLRPQPIMAFISSSPERMLTVVSAKQVTMVSCRA